MNALKELVGLAILAGIYIWTRRTGRRPWLWIAGFFIVPPAVGSVFGVLQAYDIRVDFATILMAGVLIAIWGSASVEGVVTRRLRRLLDRMMMWWIGQ